MELRRRFRVIFVDDVARYNTLILQLVKGVMALLLTTNTYVVTPSCVSFYSNPFPDPHWVSGPPDFRSHHPRKTPRYPHVPCNGTLTLGDITLAAIMLPVPLSSPTVDGHRVTRELPCGDKWSNDFLGVFQRLEPIDIDKNIA